MMCGWSCGSTTLKDFRCDVFDCWKYPPSQRKVAVNHAETFNDNPSIDVNLKVPNIADAASGMHIAIQNADQTGWKSKMCSS